jgi:hypothetical protein
MFDGVGVVVAAMNTVTLVCGGLVTMLSFRAYRRTNAPSLRALAIGIGFVTIGALVAGGLHLIFNVELAMGIVVQSSFNALGFAILAYSLFTTGATPP